MANFKKTEEKVIDESVEESFPASDSPAWSAKKSEKGQIEPESYKIILAWQRKTSSFEYEMYNREASLTFGGGETITVSNPALFFGNVHLANSEELLIASLACCYMQTFLAVCSKQGYVVDHYLDRTVGKLEKKEAGKMWIAQITLNLTVQFAGKTPSAARLTELRDKAHEYCFIANTLRSEITIHLQ